MALPKTLKAFNVFNAGENHVGLAEEIALPKLTRKTEDWRGGGMNGPIKLDFGQEGIVFESTYGGLMKSILAQYGVMKHDGVHSVRHAGQHSTSTRKIEIRLHRRSLTQGGGAGARISDRPRYQLDGNRRGDHVSVREDMC